MAPSKVVINLFIDLDLLWFVLKNNNISKYITTVKFIYHNNTTWQGIADQLEMDLDVLNLI